MSRIPAASHCGRSSTSMLDMPDSATNSSARNTPISALEAASTPPTSVTVSIAPSEPDGGKDEMAKDNAQDTNSTNEPRRSVRSRAHVPTYNDKMLSGHAVHTRRSYRKDDDPWTHSLSSMEALKRTVSGVTLVNHDNDSPSKQLLAENNKALDMDIDSSRNSTPRSRPQRRKSLRVSTSNALASASTVLEKRGRDALESAKDKLQGLGRTASLRSRAPKAAEPSTSKSPVKKKLRMFPHLAVDVTEDEEDSESDSDSDEEMEPPKPRKLWMSAGMYAGQTREETQPKGRARKSITNSSKERRILPLPMYKGERLLNEGQRDFQLPYDILNPLPKCQHPKDWKNIVKNRFVGDAFASWGKDKETLSKCQCEKETGCDEDCLNRTMRYECNDGNCNVGAEHCKNRSFAQLKWRKEGKNATRMPAKKESNLWGEGIEVTKTEDRGYGVRAMRSFEPGQIIVEYTGEIITQEEADRRMNQEYKDQSNYYMMTFHKGLIIDGYRGSICRFVNHSCDPNCTVEKWTVDGQPRMALFAGPSGIMTGDEITYDYNFAPFSKKNTQKCLCGAENCRGILGPKKATDSKLVKAAASASKLVGGAKRKILAAFGKNSAPGTPVKRRRVMSASPQEKRKSMDPRTAALPAVEPVSKVALELQQLSRQERALRRSSSTIAIKSRRGRSLRNSRSVTSFRVGGATPKRTLSQKKRLSLPLARTSSIKKLVKNTKKAGSAIAARTTSQRKSAAGLPSTKRAVSGSSSTSRLLGKSSLRQSRLSFNDSSMLSIEMPDTPTSSLRQSGRAHKPSPKVRENTLHENAPTMRASSGKKRAVSKETSASAQAQKPMIKSKNRDIWSFPGSDDDRDGTSTPKSASRGKSSGQSQMTPHDSPRRLSKRAPKPSPKVLENALADTSVAGNNTGTVSKRYNSSALGSMGRSLNSGFKNAAKAVGGGSGLRKVKALMSSGLNGDKAVTKTMRKISGAE